MRRTTEQWEALLDGTTDGPWEVETIPELRYSNGETWEELGYHVVYGENGPLFATDEQTVEDAEQYQDNEANIRLAAHAPAAVAEVVRLRRALEAQLKELSDELEAEGVETHDDIDGTWHSMPMQRYGELSEMIDQRNFLTRILEGDNDG